MKLEDCINDSEFRKEFIRFDLNGIEEIINGNLTALEHNKAKISIFEEIQKKLKLDELESEIIDEHLETLKEINSETQKVNGRLQVLIGIYKKYIDLPSGNLKLAR